MLDEKILNKNSVPGSLLMPEGCLILVDKPLTWTSFDVVNKIRFAIKHAYGIKKCKVGHAGTLDPLASGLLLVCTGPFTKLIDGLQNQSKVYSGTIQLGATTPTYDAESTPENFLPVPDLSEEMLAEVESHFTGPQQQVPPVYSAIKIEGKKAYQLARRGDDVELKPRSIDIYSINLTIVDKDRLQFEVHCSKGTYIRSLAHDIGRYLQCGAYLHSLRREAIGAYRVDDSMQLDEIIRFIQQEKG